MSSDYYLESLADVTGIPADEIRRQLKSGGRVSVSAEQATELARRGAERSWQWFETEAATGDYSSALFRLGSEYVAHGILHVDAEYGLEADEARAILREHWTRCDEPRDAIGGLLDIFKRAGYVSDTQERLRGVLTIYRGTFGDDPTGGLSWTLDEERARWFAARGDAAQRTVWAAEVDADAILGYFVERDEREVVADPTTLRDARVVSRLGH